MFYSDFLYYKYNCKSITGLEYAKLQFGPVPDQFESILNELCKDDIINYNINANKKYDRNVFSDDEFEILERVKNKFETYGSKDITDFSHKEKAFITPEYGDKISYDYAFDIESI